MNLNTIWHMHQPDYRDSSGMMQMPWVFLHCIKDYYDMPWMLSRHQNIKATFNITPPLIEQIKLYYDEPQKQDYFLSLWLKNPRNLEKTEREWMVKICKSTQFETMVKPFSEYQILYKKEYLSDRELVDIQLLFMLSWCGVYLRENSQTVSKLISKGKNYDEFDKIELLKELGNFIKTIFGFYKNLKNSGKISISTTPFNHPILPLLADMENAKKANPSTNIPNNHKPLIDDAKLQISRAITLFKETFDFTPQGFWPAEGAVDEKSIKLLEDFKIKWIATDEAILFKSLQNSNKENLYYPYKYKDMIIAFRDHGLSDKIGFTYRFWEESKASDDFINSLYEINQQNQNALVSVILDGENAWEFYKNNGFDFFNSLYEKLDSLSWCRCVTMDEVSRLKPKNLTTLAPGSWINGEFNTWVGDSEKTKAWEFIFKCKDEFEKQKNNLKTSIKEQITKHFLAAECSDWFWWYGDDHQTSFAEEFDKLFRKQLIEIYDLMQIAPPGELFLPICKTKNPISYHTTPTTQMSPMIDGKRYLFFKWLGSGVIDETKSNGAMDREVGLIKKIYYGLDEQSIYFAFETDKPLKLNTLTLYTNETQKEIKIPLKQGIVDINKEIKYALNEWLEIEIKKSYFEQKNIKLKFEFKSNDEPNQILPSFGDLEIDLDEDYVQNWFI